ncbi:MAG: hypothetical protein C4K60_17785 [Ideonella sp. MAG2]|nr:MAG: hypothetical protein C4K60_17785 [Ideonella sp. MAG2]
MKKGLQQKLLVDFRELDLRAIFSLMAVFSLAYGLFILYIDETGVPLTDIFAKAQTEPHAILHLFNWHNSPYFLPVMMGLIGCLALYLAFFAYFSYRATLKYIPNSERVKFQAIVLSHGLTNLFDLILTPLALIISGSLIYIFTGDFLTLDDASRALSASINHFFESVPTIVELPYPLSFLTAILATDLVIYLKHRLVHESRFLWYVVHRSHHTPEYLHVMGTGPVYGFDFLLKTPTILLALVLSKIFSNEPLFIETVVFYSLGLLVGQFSHTTAFYQFAYHNRLIHVLSHFFGSGIYHYTHHSAVEGEEVKNLSGNIFMFWDRVFGTYLKPRPDTPPVGLTHQPDIVLNPLVLYFSGLRKICFELKHNHPRYWFSIVFGSVYFTPPVTQDELILSYSKRLTAS